MTLVYQMPIDHADGMPSSRKANDFFNLRKCKVQALVEAEAVEVESRVTCLINSFWVSTKTIFFLTSTND
jgi:hypothetical protein